MRRSILFVAAALIVAACAAPPARAHPTPPPADYDPNFNYDCDRTCLNAFLDQVIAAMVAHDASSLPLARDVKYTENGQLLRIGDGFWATASGSPAGQDFWGRSSAGARNVP